MPPQPGAVRLPPTPRPAQRAGSGPPAPPRATVSLAGLATLVVATVALLVGVTILVVLNVRESHGVAAPHVVLADPPSDAPVHGRYVSAQVRQDGTVHVTAWLRPVHDVDQLRLSRPPGRTGVHDLVVGADQLVVQRRDSLGVGPDVVTLVQPARQVYVSYDLTGAVRQDPSRPGRAVVLLRLPELGYAHADGPAVVVLRGGRLLSVRCLQGAAISSCGSADGDAWRVRWPDAADESDLQAVVDLG